MLYIDAGREDGMAPGSALMQTELEQRQDSRITLYEPLI